MQQAMAPPAGGGGGADMQQQLLTVIRNFVAERSQGERRVADLSKRLLGLQAELETANAGLQGAKQSREAAERGLRGVEVELSMADSSVLALKGRIHLLQEEVSSANSDLAALKSKEEHLRDEFINKMCEFNKKIRNFREKLDLSLKKEGHLVFPFDHDHRNRKKDEKPVTQDMIKDVEDKILEINVQLDILEQKYQRELAVHDEILQMLANVEKRASLGEAIVEETKQLQELARQTAESEKTYAALGEEIQRRFTCPGCQINNMGFLEGTPPGVEG